LKVVIECQQQFFKTASRHSQQQVLEVVDALMSYLLDTVRFLMVDGSTGLNTITLVVALVRGGRALFS
jgi:hypothetical protein